MAPEIVGALIGTITVALSLFLGEVLRRRQRAEAYASTVFLKRLEVYEGLWARVSAGQHLAQQAITGDHTDEERKGLVSVAVLDLASYGDENAFYLDEELTVHCTTLFMGVEDAVSMGSEERKRWDENYSKRIRQTRRMIMEAAGVAQINQVFRAVNKPRLDSEVIKYFQRQARKINQADARG